MTELAEQLEIEKCLLNRKEDYCGCGDGIYPQYEYEGTLNWASRLFLIGWRVVDGKLRCEGCMAGYEALED